jgi:hypothetical protein
MRNGASGLRQSRKSEPGRKRAFGGFWRPRRQTFRINALPDTDPFYVWIEFNRAGGCYESVRDDP